MIAGHLTKKRGYWHMVLELKSKEGKRYQKWIGTGLKEQGTKKRALEMLYQKRVEYTEVSDLNERSESILFDRYIEKWLLTREGEVASTTYANYHFLARSISEYFRPLRIELTKLQPCHISEYYQYLLGKKLSPNTVIKYHSVIHNALKLALQNGLVTANVADRAAKPKTERYITIPYTNDELNRLIHTIRGDSLETVILLALFTGLRRSEILGLKWDAVDFVNGVIHIRHSIHRSWENGHYVTAGFDKLKRRASFRTLPMPEAVRLCLLHKITKQYGDFPPNPNDYICVSRKGKVFSPNHVTNSFKQILQRNNLRVIRFHDLRHSCANMLILARVPLIEVQQWLGHGSLSTTADMYAHIAYEAKNRCVDVINTALKI